MPGDASRLNGTKGGRPKGRLSDSTITKEAAREAVRQVVLRHMERMLDAQIAHSTGLKYLVARHRKTGKFAKLTEDLARAISEGSNSDYEAIEVWSKDPSVQAFTDLMNRALDKPKEQEQELRLTGEADLIAALMAGRKRAKDATRRE